MQHLYERIFYNPKVNGLFTDDAVIASMLRFESALAQAQAEQDVIPAAVAPVIGECCRVENINRAQLVAEAAPGGNTAIPLVKQLTAALGQKNREAAKYVHFGATSQDVLNTAMMLMVKEAVEIIAEDLKQLTKQLVSLVEEHKATVMIGRSFMQQARPITFGYKAAGWLQPLLRFQKAIEVRLQQGFLCNWAVRQVPCPACRKTGCPRADGTGQEKKTEQGNIKHLLFDEFCTLAVT